MRHQVDEIASNAVEGPVEACDAMISQVGALPCRHEPLVRIGPLAEQGVAFHCESGRTVAAFIGRLTQSQSGRNDVELVECLFDDFRQIIALLSQLGCLAESGDAERDCSRP